MEKAYLSTRQHQFSRVWKRWWNTRSRFDSVFVMETRDFQCEYLAQSGCSFLWLLLLDFVWFRWFSANSSLFARKKRCFNIGFCHVSDTFSLCNTILISKQLNNVICFCKRRQCHQLCCLFVRSIITFLLQTLWWCTNEQYIHMLTLTTIMATKKNWIQLCGY